MPRFRSWRIKDAPAESFRWAAHTGGLAIVKPKDYEAGGEVASPTPYAAWKLLEKEGRPLRPGDLLESIGDGGHSGELQIAKYIGFEPARWYVPEPAAEDNAAAEDSPASAESISHL